MPIRRVSERSVSMRSQRPRKLASLQTSQGPERRSSRIERMRSFMHSGGQTREVEIGRRVVRVGVGQSYFAARRMGFAILILRALSVQPRESGVKGRRSYDCG